MMHAFGMVGLGICLSVIGLLSVILLGGGLFVLLRRFGRLGGSREEHRLNRKQQSIPKRREAAASELFRLAKRHRGFLTVSDVVSEMGLDPKDAEQLLQGLTDGQRVDMRVDNDGVVHYVFPELESSLRHS